MSKKSKSTHLGISWQTMKVGKMEYKGTAYGAKSSCCRSSKQYAPKKWRSYCENGIVYVERLI